MIGMKKIQIFTLFLFILPMLLSGTVSAALQGNISQPHTVTQVRVVCQHKGNTMTRCYTRPYKMETVLNYLRLLKHNGQADTDPERLMGDCFEITLYYSNGQQGIYRQRANRYLSKNAHAWGKIVPEQAQLLYPMLQSMPSDI